MTIIQKGCLEEYIFHWIENALLDQNSQSWKIEIIPDLVKTLVELQDV